MGSGDGLGGCHACIKYLMFAFNFIFWLIGCALVGVGIWIMVDENFKDLSVNDEFAFLQYAGIALIAVGGVIMVVGFFGCCGAIRESQCLLVMFFICMLILFLVLVAAGVACLLYKDEVTDVVLKTFSESVDAYKDDTTAAAFVDLVQAFFQCCGKTSSLDYLFDVPESCPDQFISVGCNTKVPNGLEEHVVVAAGVTLGSGAVMLLGMIFSMMLCCAIRDQA